MTVLTVNISVESFWKVKKMKRLERFERFDPGRKSKIFDLQILFIFKVWKLHFQSFIAFDSPEILKISSKFRKKWHKNW